MQQASKDRAGDLQRTAQVRGCSTSCGPSYCLALAPGLSHLILSLVYPDQEEQLCQKEVDAQVLVDGVAVGLQTPQEAEGGDTDGQTDQGDDDANPGDD